MSITKKAALYDEFPVALVSTFLVIILLVGLHIMVLSTNSSSSDENGYSEKELPITTNPFIKDFLQMTLNESQKQQYRELIDKDLDENVTVKHALTSSFNESEEFFRDMKSLYVEENRVILENFFEFTSSNSEDVQDFLQFGRITFERRNWRSFDDECGVFHTGNVVLLPPRSLDVDQEYLLLIFEPNYSLRNCIYIEVHQSNGGEIIA